MIVFFFFPLPLARYNNRVRVWIIDAEGGPTGALCLLVIVRWSPIIDPGTHDVGAVPLPRPASDLSHSDEAFKLIVDCVIYILSYNFVSTE